METKYTITKKQERYLRHKRALDIICSGIAILLLFPVLLLIGIAIRVDSKGPVIFKQRRAGIGDTYFEIWKFRTMYNDAPRDVPTHLLKNADAMTTKAGRVLRRTSLDELPQLFNIFLGHMSVVGPRPALWNQEDLIAARKSTGANLVLPGLTGWAQINGRDEISMEEKVHLDAEYVRKVSFSFDCKCFFSTFTKVLKREGVKE